MTSFALSNDCVTHHDAAGVERAEPARQEDCGSGRRGGLAT